MIWTKTEGDDSWLGACPDGRKFYIGADTGLNQYTLLSWESGVCVTKILAVSSLSPEGADVLFTIAEEHARTPEHERTNH